jgi:hypothetical protein
MYNVHKYIDESEQKLFKQRRSKRAASERGEIRSATIDRTSTPPLNSITAIDLLHKGATIMRQSAPREIQLRPHIKRTTRLGMERGE